MQPNATASPPEDYPRHHDAITGPGAAILALLFLICPIILILIYTKYLNRLIPSTATHRKPPGLTRKTIRSLPLFRFDALAGSNDVGLECPVCLSKYQHSDILRLLPSCTHSFHVDCVDRWLPTNSTCPLCRTAVTASRASLPSSSNTASIAPAADININIDVLREAADEGIEVFKKKKKKMAVVSGVVFKSRWSDVSCSDMMCLNSPAIFCDAEGSAGGGSSVRRSLSEITVVQRFAEMEWRGGTEEGGGGVEEKKRRVWVAMAKKTVEWFVSKGGTEKGGRSEDLLQP